jgi:hypothetical protein
MPAFTMDHVARFLVTAKSLGWPQRSVSLDAIEGRLLWPSEQVAEVAEFGHDWLWETNMELGSPPTMLEEN